MTTIQTRQADPLVVEQLMQDGLTPLLARVYAARGVSRASEAAGTLAELLPYTSLRQCEETATLIAEAMEMDARFHIVADYDCDGATACSVVLRAMRGFGALIDYTVPDRQIHGYGLTPSIVQDVAAIEPRPHYIITVDNGIASNAGVEEAMRLGMDVLVTDHHLPGATLPPARCMVNPNHPECSFESKNMAGVGVAFYVMWALRDELARRGHPGGDFDIFSLLPLVAVGTVADVVKLDRNNRILVDLGLKMIRKRLCQPGILAIAAVAGRDVSKLSTSDIGFAIGPRINAAGRLETMHAGIECLTSDDIGRVTDLANELNAINASRREVEAGVVAEAIEQLVANTTAEGYTVALHAEGWHEGVIGIAAGRIKERLYRPTFIFTTNSAGELKGSGRSIPGFHLRDAMDLVSKRDPDVFLKFGGHAMAAGATIRPGKFEAFRTLFEEVARELMTPDVLEQVLETDGELTLADMTLRTVSSIAPAVWGQGFPEPCFQGHFRVKMARRIGKDQKHLSLVLDVDGQEMKAVRFNYEESELPAEISGVYKLAGNTFRGQTTLQLMFDTLNVEVAQPALAA